MWIIVDFEPQIIWVYQFYIYTKINVGTHEIGLSIVTLHPNK